MVLELPTCSGNSVKGGKGIQMISLLNNSSLILVIYRKVFKGKMVMKTNTYYPGTERPYRCRKTKKVSQFSKLKFGLTKLDSLNEKAI